MILTGTVSVKLKNGRIINGFYTKDCRDVVVRCYDSDFFLERHSQLIQQTSV